MRLRDISVADHAIHAPFS